MISFSPIYLLVVYLTIWLTSSVSTCSPFKLKLRDVKDSYLLYFAVKSPHWIPIILAVLPLSPVSIQVWIPARWKSTRQRATSCWSKSSTHEAPCRLKQPSISSYVNTPSMSGDSSSFSANVSVRKPYDANSSIRCKIVFSSWSSKSELKSEIP